MTGLEQAQEYYEKCGRETLARQFPECWERVAVGLVGEGSECFGYDDAISQDHDFGGGFCLWLIPGDYEKYGKAMEAAYNALPQMAGDIKKRPPSPMGGDRVGVWSIPVFYRSCIGYSEAPPNNRAWMAIPDYRLATATNGILWVDPEGEFTRIREALLKGYPEDVWLRKLAGEIHTMSQTGQYNYARCMQRGDAVTAAICLSEFAQAAMRTAFLLNHRYAPYYKWMHRGLRDLPLLADLEPLLRTLFLAPDQRDKWTGMDILRWRCQINTADDCVRVIEKISDRIRAVLLDMGLSQADSDFLDHHTGAILSRITDDALRRS
ncbi:MAG: DUF4037 domain-containing protein [Eubacterium sp.]